MTAALLSPGTTQALDLAREALVTLGPAGDLKAQIRYLTSTWPDQHAIAVVTTEAPARCGAFSAEKGGCTQEVRLSGSILVRWLAADPKPPGVRFAVHF